MRGSSRKASSRAAVTACLFSGASDLQNDLVENRLIQGTPNYSSVFARHYGLLTVSVCTDEPDEVRTRILRTVGDALKGGFGEEEVARNRKAAVASLIQSFDSSEGVADMMSKYGSRACTVFDMLRIYATVTPADCRRVFRRTVDAGLYTSVLLSPPGGAPQSDSPMEEE